MFTFFALGSYRHYCLLAFIFTPYTFAVSLILLSSFFNDFTDAFGLAICKLDGPYSLTIYFNSHMMFLVAPSIIVFKCALNRVEDNKQLYYSFTN